MGLHQYPLSKQEPVSSSSSGERFAFSPYDIYYPGAPTATPHRSGDNQTTGGLTAPATKEERSSITTPKMWGNYEKSESTKPVNADDSDEDSSPAIVLPGLPGVHS